jgi:PAS domain S-box-containing protein
MVNRQRPSNPAAKSRMQNDSLSSRLLERGKQSSGGGHQRVDVGQGRTYIRRSDPVKTLKHPMSDPGPTISAAPDDAEQVFRERDQFRGLANAVAQLIWMADANGSVQRYNQRWYDFTGTSLEEVQGWGWAKVHHPDHVAPVVAQRRQCVETGEPWEDTFPLRGVDGGYRWFLSRAVPMRRGDGSVAGWFGTKRTSPNS